MGEVMEERRIYQEAEWNVVGSLIVAINTTEECGELSARSASW